MKDVLNYTLFHQKRVLDKMIKLLRNDKLHYKPKPVMRTPVEIYHHIFQMVLAYGLGVRDGVGQADHLDAVSFNPSEIASSTELISYGDDVCRLILDAAEKFTDKDFEREIIYTQWDYFKLNGTQSIGTISDEMAHHKGQLSVYLRLLDIDPPFLYDFS